MIPFFNPEFGWDSSSIGRWIKMHGLMDPQAVYSFSITVDYTERSQYVTFHRYALNESGQKYAGEDGEVVKDEPFTVPLLCLPPIWSQAELERIDGVR